MRINLLLRKWRGARVPGDPFSVDDRPADAFERGWRHALKQRIVVVLAGIGLWGAAIELRLVQLQVFQHDELEAKARRHQEQRLPLEALRGDILDRNGQLLAYSVEAKSIAADPGLVNNPAATAAAVCTALGDCSGSERRELAGKLSSHRRYEVIRRSQEVSPEQIARIRDLNLPGIVTQSDTRRYYPRYELGAHVLGFVGRDNNGQAGVEYAFDKIIRGEDGLAFVQVDAKRQRLESRLERAPVPGASLQLTLDLGLQHIAERELKAGVRASRAKAGTVVIMAPATGEILALASYPTFNPNAVTRSTDDERRNRAVQDVYEPGSTFKIVTASAAIEEGVTTPDELIDTTPGYIRIGARVIDDDHRYGVLSFEDVIVKSSNVGAIRIGLRTGIERLSRYVHRFGFGEALAPDFVGQSRGLWNPNGLDEGGLASVSMGYQVSVTPLQMAAAVSAVANGGLLMQPRILRSVVLNGRRDVVAPKALRRAISAETAATLTAMMEGVVSDRGTARAAMLGRHQVAGKTGTAKKLVNNRYSDTDYNASFVGFVPSRQPAFTILVVIDTPRGGTYYGGTVAAPIFKRIAEAALRHAGVPATIDPVPSVLASADGASLPPRATPAVSLVAALTPVGGLPLMPDVTGMSARQALRVLTGAGLAVRLRGAGFVSTQFPDPGAPLAPGGWARVELTRSVPPADELRGDR
jgi:cell division protein FtsI (penicillin-binding protein 3)